MEIQKSTDKIILVNDQKVLNFDNNSSEGKAIEQSSSNSYISEDTTAWDEAIDALSPQIDNLSDIPPVI